MGTLLVILLAVGATVWLIFFSQRRAGESDLAHSSFPLSPSGPSAKPMAKPTSREFTFDDEARLAAARQRIWIQYEDYNGNETERKIELYCPQEDDEYLFAWCCQARAPRTFNRNKIVTWQILDEQFEFTPLVEQYFREEGSRDWQERIPWERWKANR